MTFTTLADENAWTVSVFVFKGTRSSLQAIVHRTVAIIIDGVTDLETACYGVARGGWFARGGAKPLARA